MPFSTEGEGTVDRRENPSYACEQAMWRQKFPSTEPCCVQAPGALYVLWPVGKTGKETSRTWGKGPLDGSAGVLETKKRAHGRAFQNRREDKKQKWSAREMVVRDRYEKG